MVCGAIWIGFDRRVPWRVFIAGTGCPAGRPLFLIQTPIRVIAIAFFVAALRLNRLTVLCVLQRFLLLLLLCVLDLSKRLLELLHQRHGFSLNSCCSGRPAQLEIAGGVLHWHG